MRTATHPRSLLFLLLLPVALTLSASQQQTLAEQNKRLFERLREVHELSEGELQALSAIFAGSRVIGQGNPANAVHPMTPAECRKRATDAGARYENPEFERICGDKYMAPLYDPSTESPPDARACIDQFEFPDIPCEYPVVWVKAR